MIRGYIVGDWMPYISHEWASQRGTYSDISRYGGNNVNQNTYYHRLLTRHDERKEQLVPGRKVTTDILVNGGG